MGFSLAHMVAQPLGWSARALGAVSDVAPGKGTSSLTKTGQQITSPYASPMNILTSGGGTAMNPAPARAAGPAVAGGGGGGGASLGANAGAGGSGYGYDAYGSYVPGGGYTDPNAARRQSWMGALGGALGNIRSNATDAFGSGVRSLQGSAEGLFNEVKQGQGAIDRSRENVELNRLSGVKDILGFVRNGLKQGSARLANMNSGESSAAGEIARQFGLIGGDRMRSVGNSAFLQNRDIDTQQDALNLKRGQGTTDFQRARDDIVSTIGQQVRQQLAELDSQGAQLGANGQVDVEGEKQRVINAGIGALNNVDQWLQGQLGGVQAEGQDKVRSNAVALEQGGTGNITPFDFTGSEGGMQVQGPAIDQLPLFTRTRKITG